MGMLLKPLVLNARISGTKILDSVYVGRPSKFGNPFTSGSRFDNIEKYKEYFYSNEQLQQDAIAELRGKHLICWCAPAPCHADILLEFVNK